MRRDLCECREEEEDDDPIGIEPSEEAAIIDEMGDFGGDEYEDG